MIFFIAMLIAMIVFGAIGEFVDDKILYPVLIGLLIFFSLLMVYLKNRAKK